MYMFQLKKIFKLKKDLILLQLRFLPGFKQKQQLGLRPRRKVKHWTPKGDCKVAGINERDQLQFY